MAVDQPKDEVPALWPMADAHDKYCICPYFCGDRQGRCWLFFKYGPSACYKCGWERGYEAGEHDGYIDGRIDERSEFDDDFDPLAEFKEMNA